MTGGFGFGADGAGGAPGRNGRSPGGCGHRADCSRCLRSSGRPRPVA